MRAAVCLNCGEPLLDRFCAACGQRGDAGHRSLGHLAAEAAEVLTHADSRLWRTLRRLLLRPGRLTRDYLFGRRTAQIPPLRLFLVAMFVLFGVGSLSAGHVDIGTMSPAAHREVETAIGKIAVPQLPRLQHWLRLHLLLALDRPDGVIETMREWSERITALLLPAAALMLWALFAPARRPEGGRFTLFDHLVFSMHSLSATGLLLTVQFALRTVTTHADPLLLLLPVHLFRHMRGTYGSGVVATLLRMAVLFGGSVVVAAVLLTVLAGLGLQFGTHRG